MLTIIGFLRKLSINWYISVGIKTQMSSAWVLAGHGSHISPQTAGLVWAHVDALRRRGVADEVTAAFWKEAPSFHTVVQTLQADEITVIPLFTAQGYFTQTVIPAEMNLSGAVTRREGRLIRYTRTLSEHPYLSQMVQQRVQDALAAFELDGTQTAVAIIGHSTRRNPESRKATEAQAEQLRALGWVAQVEAAYLDDVPEIHTLYQRTSAPFLVAVPYFLALGSHTTIDVPAALGLAPGTQRGQVQGRQVFYTAPVGVDSALLDVIVELAQEAGGPAVELHSATHTAESEADVWSGFPRVGRAALWEAVNAAGVLRFGGLRLTPAEVRVWGDTAAVDALTTPSALRQRVRENPFRSLPTSDDLPRGWHVPVTSATQLHAAVETIYPGSVADWAAARAGTFVVTPLQAVAARQTGMYRRLQTLSPERERAIVGRVCERCVRGPSWHFDSTPSGRLPCPEACNHWLSAALEEL